MPHNTLSLLERKELTFLSAPGLLLTLHFLSRALTLLLHPLPLLPASGAMSPAAPCPQADALTCGPFPPFNTFPLIFLLP